MTASLIAVGRVAKPHGVRGELKVDLYWEGSTSLLEVDRVVLAFAQGPLHTRLVESVRPTPRYQLLKVAGIDDLTEAGRWRGAEIRVARAVLPPLEAGAYYLADLVGARVVSARGELGVVVEVRPYPTVDTIVIEDATGRRHEQPLVEPWLTRVDAENGVVELGGVEGFLD
ncbi:MAG: 16S rRNA processing protein RimM [Polyangiaceae bacterium]|nr:16S rRNA processing protein RimM [Polyangiaceae bacterium]